MSRSELPPVWVGVDPGGRYTGVAATRGDDLLGHLVIEREPGEPAWEYGRRVLKTIQVLRWDLPPVAGYMWAVEDLVPINPHVRNKPINPTPLIDTAVVLGAVTSWVPNPTIVRPAGHGSHPLGCYPAELVTDGERRKAGWQMRVGKSSNMRHARSAWDVIQAARLTHRANAAYAAQARSQPVGGGEAA